MMEILIMLLLFCCPILLPIIIVLWNRGNTKKDNTQNYSYFNPTPVVIHKTTYNDLLNCDEWKQKRTQILTRDNYTCRYCGSRYNLQIHHKYYVSYPNNKKALPWDYPDKALITVCDTCHKRIHQNNKIKIYYRKNKGYNNF